jgi:DNA-binding transcriptional regulator YhcF (GntR family)
MVGTNENADETPDRRTAKKMREVVELVIVELRRIGVTEEDIKIFLSRSREHWRTTGI